MPEPMVPTIPTFHMANAGEDRGPLVKEVFEVLQEMSELLNTGLSPEVLALCVQLCERGAHPTALAQVFSALRELPNQQNGGTSANTATEVTKTWMTSLIGSSAQLQPIRRVSSGIVISVAFWKKDIDLVGK